MKFLTLVAATLAVVAAGASADASIEARDLPAMSKHPLSMQRRDAILNRRHNQQRVAKRGSKRASKNSCKAKTHKAASGMGKKTTQSAKQHSSASSNSSAQSQSHSQAESQSNSHASSQSSEPVRLQGRLGCQVQRLEQLQLAVAVAVFW